MRKIEVLYAVFINVMVIALIVGCIPVKPVEAQQPYLRYVTEYYNCPMIDSNPHGKLNVIITICKLMNDGTSSYDWYFYGNVPQGNPGIRVQSVPGTVAYGSSWVTAHIYSNFYVKYTGTNRWLYDYDPTTTDGYSSSGVSASVSVSGPSYTLSYSYSIPYIKVEDYSDFSTHMARWRHDFNEMNDDETTSELSYLARPAFVVKTTQDSTSYVDADFAVRFGYEFLWWSYQDFYSSTYYFDARYVGDS